MNHAGTQVLAIRALSTYHQVLVDHPPSTDNHRHEKCF